MSKRCLPEHLLVEFSRLPHDARLRLLGRATADRQPGWLIDALRDAHMTAAAEEDARGQTSAFLDRLRGNIRRKLTASEGVRHG